MFFVVRFPDVYSEENCKATMLHPWFKNSGCLNVTNSKQQMVSDIALELNVNNADLNNVEEHSALPLDTLLVILSYNYKKLEIKFHIQISPNLHTRDKMNKNHAFKFVRNL